MIFCVWFVLAMKWRILCFKELLVCECVFIYHLKRKSYYICIFSWIFQMLERLVSSHKQQCTMFYHGLSWCYVVLKWSLFLMSQLLNTLILYFRVEVFFLCWTTAVYSSIIFFTYFWISYQVSQQVTWFIFPLKWKCETVDWSILKSNFCWPRFWVDLKIKCSAK